MRLLASLIVTATLATPASAAVPGLFRAYLSVAGNDANPCTLAQPCRLLPAALNAVADGGEVWMLDSANYNSGLVTIAKSVTVLAVPGVVGSVVSTGSGNPAIRVPAGSLDVTLRNLVVTGLAGATAPTSGVEVNSGSHVLLVDCDLSRMNSGLVVNDSARATLLRGLVRSMSGNGAFADTSAVLAVDGTKFVGNGTGISAQSLSPGIVLHVTVKDATLSNNSIGVQAAALGGGSAWVYLDHSTVVASTNRGLNLISGGVGSSALVNLNASRLTNIVNATSTGTGSSIASFGNNAVSGGILLGVNQTPFE